MHFHQFGTALFIQIHHHNKPTDPPILLHIHQIITRRIIIIGQLTAIWSVELPFGRQRRTHGRLLMMMDNNEWTTHGVVEWWTRCSNGCSFYQLNNVVIITHQVNVLRKAANTTRRVPRINRTW